jgi:hypothetical protein
MGAIVSNLVGLGEVSRFGAPDETGVVIEGAPSVSVAANSDSLQMIFSWRRQRGHPRHKRISSDVGTLEAR